MECEAFLPYFFTALTHVSGRFRWVYCQLEYLGKCLPGRIQHALDELPSTLDETYERTLREIDDTNWEFARRLLLCVAVASRPLCVEELAEIIAFDFKTGPIPKFHEEWRLEGPVETVLSTCSTLLSVVDRYGSPFIQFSHFSVKELLTSPRFADRCDYISRRYHVSMTPAHTLIAQACLGILLHLDKTITKDRLGNFPLAEYAAERWFEHACVEGVSENAEEGMKQLFDPSKPHLAVWVWIYDPMRPWNRYNRPERPVSVAGTPLHYAASCGLHNFVKVLVIERSQDVHARSVWDKSTPLHSACGNGHVEVACVLIEHGANAMAQDENGLTPLHQASRCGNVDLAQFLVGHSADATAQDNNGLTPLHEALGSGNVGLARFLVEHGADATAQDNNGLTPLHQASGSRNVDLAGFLVEHGADTTARDKTGSTPLHQLCGSYYGNVDFALFLIEHGADATAQDKNGSTPLHRASGSGNMDLAGFLVEHGADLAAQDKNGSTPLHQASLFGRVELVRLLIGHGANAAAQDKKHGSTPLHLASRSGHPEVVQTLLTHGAYANIRDESGWTPLHFASQEGHEEVVRLLLNYDENNGALPIASDMKNTN